MMALVPISPPMQTMDEAILSFLAWFRGQLRYYGVVLTVRTNGLNGSVVQQEHHFDGSLWHRLHLAVSLVVVSFLSYYFL
jgi:hypothetical protein